MSASDILNPEARFVYGLATLERGSKPQPTRADGGTPFSWEEAIEIAERERAIPVLQDYVKTLGVSGLTPEQSARVQRATVRSAMSMSHLALRLDGVLRAYHDAQIPVVLLKGAALAVTVYPSFARRPMRDLDLLVPAARARDAWEIARTVGWQEEEGLSSAEFYNAHHHLTPLFDTRGSRLGLELHIALFPLHHPFQITPDDVWRDATEAVVGEHRVLVPSAPHMMLHSCVHFAWSNEMRDAGWRTFRDIGTVVASGRVNWDEFVATAKHTRAATCCYWTLRLGQSLAGLDVPARTLEALQPPLAAPILRRLERFYAAHLCPPRGWQDPTVRLSKLMWAAGIQPKRSGHGATRPWLSAATYTDETASAALPPPPRSVAERAGQLLREIGVLVR